MKKLLYVGLFFSFSSLAEVALEKNGAEHKSGLSRFRAPASIIEREHLAQRAEKNIARPKLKVEKKLVNPPTELPVRLKQLTPGGTSE